MTKGVLLGSGRCAKNQAMETHNITDCNGGIHPVAGLVVELCVCVCWRCGFADVANVDAEDWETKQELL